LGCWTTWYVGPSPRKLTCLHISGRVDKQWFLGQDFARFNYDAYTDEWQRLTWR
jgi:hypothetical protein